ncbi:MAG: hypothetical protein A2Y62_15750 [Candidatus Fischerbacteria bacterium RBG_13_37_8]|uniref:SLH domain-containing protein n=1 Tax=Candidatus Fischerbacteria bacterium RBG_13_37_8 TaxID=1817863 RepID=A0A1F5VW29_9BACT|nr:MAG: hypothetical protein A2Y62_15750 [Candidatus Fischerbacteria bacterium RBG_13_37_8]
MLTANVFCPFIEALYQLQVVSGCQANPLLFCPLYSTQRQAMAKMVCLAMEIANPGSCPSSPCTGIFTDVPTDNPFCGYIEALYNAGVISGCGASLFCPNEIVSRDQMAKFLVNAFDLSM